MNGVWTNSIKTAWCFLKNNVSYFASFAIATKATVAYLYWFAYTITVAISKISIEWHFIRNRLEPVRTPTTRGQKLFVIQSIKIIGCFVRIALCSKLSKLMIYFHLQLILVQPRPNKQCYTNSGVGKKKIVYVDETADNS